MDSDNDVMVILMKEKFKRFMMIMLMALVLMMVASMMEVTSCVMVASPHLSLFPQRNI